MLKVLQLIASYLPRRQGWMHSLISQLPETHNLVGAAKFICEDPEFFGAELTLLRRPLQELLSRAGAERIAAGRFLLRLEGRWYRQRLERRARSVDVVHSHFADWGWQNHRWIRRTGRPHVISFYGYDYGLFSWGYERLFRPQGWPDEATALAAFWRCADLFLCEGEYGRQCLLRHGCPEHKAQIQHLGVAVSGIPLHARRKRPAELQLLQVAGFVEKKGQPFALAAFLQALADCPNMTLTFAGNDPLGLRQQLDERIPAYARDKVKIIDSIPFHQLRGYFKGFQVFIHPSCHTAAGDCEGGAPVVLLDAQATGLPIISTRHCDIPEEVIDGETGLLAEEKDVSTLASHIRRFYQMEQAEYDVFARQARAHVEAHYDIAHNAAHLAEIYRTLMGRPEGA
jgi:colanic acid/amylovoran biosynthesis glycosyltransferase